MIYKCITLTRHIDDIYTQERNMKIDNEYRSIIESEDFINKMKNRLIPVYYIHNEFQLKKIFLGNVTCISPEYVNFELETEPKGLERCFAIPVPDFNESGNITSVSEVILFRYDDPTYYVIRRYTTLKSIKESLNLIQKRVSELNALSNLNLINYPILIKQHIQTVNKSDMHPVVPSDPFNKETD